ncbi:hypothetical protein D3C85_1463710 [compost metagenome]
MRNVLLGVRKAGRNGFAHRGQRDQLVIDLVRFRQLLLQDALEGLLHIILEHDFARSGCRQRGEVDPQFRRQLACRRTGAQVRLGHGQRHDGRPGVSQCRLDVGDRNPTTTSGSSQGRHVHLTAIG